MPTAIVNRITDGTMVNEIKELGGSDQLLESQWSITITRPETTTREPTP